jgi:hypothetical protein
MGKRHDHRYRYSNGVIFVSKQDRIDLFSKSLKVCAVCDTKLDIGSAKYDHSHDTGEFRGWLCHHCNTAIGLMKDNPILLRLAAEYLESYDSNS